MTISADDNNYNNDYEMNKYMSTHTGFYCIIMCRSMMLSCMIVEAYGNVEMEGAVP